MQILKSTLAATTTAILIVSSFIHLPANATSSVSITLSEQTLTDYVAYKLPQTKTLYKKKNWLGSITLKGTIREAKFDIEGDKIFLDLDAKIKAKGFSDTEIIRTECDVDVVGNKLVIKPKKAIWDINVNILGLTGDIKLGEYDFLDSAPKLKKGVEIELPQQLKKDLGGIPILAENFKVKLVKDGIAVFSDFNVIPEDQKQLPGNGVRDSVSD